MRVFPRGGVVKITVDGESLSVIASGEDVSHLARRLLRISLTLLDTAPPPDLNAHDVVGLIGLALYGDSGALTLAD